VNFSNVKRRKLFLTSILNSLVTHIVASIVYEWLYWI